jgi:phosphoglycerate dehydrogenase-like enzyme
MSHKPHSIFLLDKEFFTVIYNSTALAKIKELTEYDGAVYTASEILEAPERFEAVEIIFSGWGAPVMDETLLAAMPRLKALFYGAGSVRGLVTEAFWQRDILLTSAYKANAIPVVEFSVASIVMALKHAWRLARRLRAGENCRDLTGMSGVYHGSTVGIISLGAIGCGVCERLKAFDIDVVAYDPFAAEEMFASLGTRRADSLEALFRECDVVSLHAPNLPETRHMINGPLLRSLPKNATFINTSRGAIIDEGALLEVLRERPDLFAVIDVITDESDYTASPFAQLENVFLTPHIAGSGGRECHRMG